MATVSIYTKARGFLVDTITEDPITDIEVSAFWDENTNASTLLSYPIDFDGYTNKTIDMVDGELRIKAYARTIPEPYAFSRWKLVVTDRRGNSTTISSENNPSHKNGSSKGWALEELIGDSTSGVRRATLDFYLYLVKQVTITYDANGGEGAPEEETVDAGSYTISETEPTRSGHTFSGWATSAEATQAQYSAGQTITVSEDIILYAVWDGEVPPQPTPGKHSGYLTIGSSGCLQFVPSGHLAYD